MPTAEEIQIRVSTLGTDATVNQIAKLRNEVKGLYNDSKGGSQEQKSLGDQLAYLNTRVKEMNPNFEIMRARSREARMEQRMFRFAVVELMAPLEQLSGQNKQLIQDLQGIIGAGLGVKYALSLLGGSFAAFATPIAIVTSALAAYRIMTDSLEATENRLAKATETRIDLLYKLGRVTDEQMEKLKQRAVDEAKSSAKGAGGGFVSNLGAYLSGFLTGGGVTGGASAVMTNIMAAQTEADNTVLQAQISQKDFIKKEEENEVKYLRELASTGNMNRVQLQSALYWGVISRKAYDEASAALMVQPAPVTLSSRFFISSPGGEMSIPGRITQTATSISAPVATFSDMMTQAGALEHSMKSGFQGVASVITTSIGGAFAKVFGDANTLLGSFVDQFISTFINIGMNVVSGGLWNIIQGLPFTGGTKSIVSGTKGMQGGSTAGALSLRTEISGANLALIVEKGNRINSQVRY